MMIFSPNNYQTISTHSDHFPFSYSLYMSGRRWNVFSGAQRLQIYDVFRVGIRKNRADPDWLGRWSGEMCVMMAKALTLLNEGDRLLIRVGDNHKWVLDMLIGINLKFDLQSSWEYLNYP